MTVKSEKYKNLSCSNKYCTLVIGEQCKLCKQGTLTPIPPQFRNKSDE